MLKMLTAAACLAFPLGLGVTAAQAASAPPPPKADCSMFHKLTDGRWTSTITSKVGNPKEFVTLQRACRSSGPWSSPG